jgi:predicted nucleic acid-binding protein
LVRTVLSHPPDTLLRAELGLGEAEAIALATELGGRLLLDERKARRIAEIGYGLPVRGTIGPPRRTQTLAFGAKQAFATVRTAYRQASPMSSPSSSAQLASS